MASPSVTYTFANSTTADATQVNQNFTDLINGATDGTKDYSIAAFTAANAATFNGDFIILGGAVAATIPVKTNASFDFGSSTLAMRSLYLGTSTFTTRIIGSASASWTLTLPPTGGTAHYLLRTDGSGTATWIAPVKGLSSSSGGFSGTATVATSITNMTVTATFTGRDIEISCIADGSGNQSRIALVTPSPGEYVEIQLFKDGVLLAKQLMQTPSGTSNMMVPTSSIRYIDLAPTAGSHTYLLKYLLSIGAGNMEFYYTKLSVREMF